MNLPNKLTVARLALTVVFVACFYVPLPNAMSWALFIFSIASITDYLDGYLARKHNLVTNFGKLVDPLADKILIAAAFILLVEKTEMKAWIAIAILGREFFVTGIRLVAANQGVVLAAEKLGKHKSGVACLYVNKLEDVHLPTLRKIIEESFKHTKMRTT